MKNVRITILFLLTLIVAFMSLAARCFYLQYFRADHYSSACAKQHRSMVPRLPQRGTILDCRGRVLAASNRIQIIKAEPRRISDHKGVANRLATVVNIPAHEICRLITESKNPGFAKIKVAAEPNECQAARKIAGVGVDYAWQRSYPAGPLAAHVVGFTSDDFENRGLGGIELQCDKALAGSGARDVFLADIRRRPIRFKEAGLGLTDGVGIILTIDAAIQQFARNELMKQYKDYQAESAVVIVAEPKTGEILAMVSLPDFDPADRSGIEQDFLRNCAITDQFEPGSVLKPIAAAIALDAGVVNKEEKIFCENGSYSGRGFGRIGEYRRGFGDLTLREILINSSNIGMAKIGQRLGKDRLYKGLKLFGFGKKTGIDLPGETVGLLWPVRKWTGYSVTRIPFGQEITVTAIQMLRAFCILANGGRAVRPFLIKATVSSDGSGVELNNGPPPVGFVIKPAVAKWIVNDALVGVINEGTGRRARLEKWQLFGKTGTANIAKRNEKGYSDSDYIASFVAGAPAEDPQIVVLVSIRKPNKSLGKGYTGGVVASPVAAKIIEKTLNYLEKHPR